MITLIASITVACLAGAGVFLLLRRSLLRVVLGLALLSHAANLLIITAGGLGRTTPPITPPGAASPAAPHADPLPQALILTAIVISFGVLAFFVILAARAGETSRTDDTDALGEHA